MSYTLRFNELPKWFSFGAQVNGLVSLAGTVEFLLRSQNRKNVKILEIGSYMGESALIFNSAITFDEIHCIEPFSGDEEANKELGVDWKDVKREFWTNVRHFRDKVHLHQNFTYNLPPHYFPNKKFDFIYIDASHEYDDVINDIEFALPKTDFLIGGHDYNPGVWDGVVKAVDKFFGGKDIILFDDKSWLVNLKD